MKYRHRHYFTRVEVQGIVISMSVCRLSLCLSARISLKLHFQISQNFLYMLPVAIMAVQYVNIYIMYLWFCG